MDLPENSNLLLLNRAKNAKEEGCVVAVVVRQRLGSRWRKLRGPIGANRPSINGLCLWCGVASAGEEKQTVERRLVVPESWRWFTVLGARQEPSDRGARIQGQDVRWHSRVLHEGRRSAAGQEGHHTPAGAMAQAVGAERRNHQRIGGELNSLLHSAIPFRRYFLETRHFIY